MRGQLFFETAEADDGVGNAVTHDGGIAGNGRSTRLMCASGTLFMRCSLIGRRTTGMTK